MNSAIATMKTIASDTTNNLIILFNRSLVAVAFGFYF